MWFQLVITTGFCPCRLVDLTNYVDLKICKFKIIIWEDEPQRECTIFLQQLFGIIYDIPIQLDLFPCVWVAHYGNRESESKYSYLYYINFISAPPREFCIPIYFTWTTCTSVVYPGGGRRVAPCTRSRFFPPFLIYLLLTVSDIWAGQF